MLRLAPHPYMRADADAWIASHAVERAAGTAYRFVIEEGGRMVGTCDLDEIADRSGDLGYWLEEVAWGRGIATEASRAVVEFGFADLGLERLTSGHAADNPNSGRILAKLGFTQTGRARLWSRPRNTEIDQLKYERKRPP